MFGRMQHFWTAPIHHYTYYFYSVLFLSSWVCVFLWLPQIKFFKMTLHINNRISRIQKLASAITAVTSSRKYWYHVRSSTAERKWGAPLCRITYSVQYTACCSGVSGWSRMMRERRWAFSRYLWQTRSIIGFKYEKVFPFQKRTSPYSSVIFPHTITNTFSWPVYINANMWLPNEH